jgi:molybdate transport system substrate-binding protein
MSSSPPGEIELQQLRTKHLINESTVRDFGSLDMAVIAPSARPGISTLKDLTSIKVRSISMGDPNSTSVGHYGAEMLHKAGLWDQLQSRLVLREAPLEAFSLVESGEVDAGIVYLMCPLETGRGKVSSSAVRFVEKIPHEICPPVRLQLGRLEASTNRAAAQTFIDFVASKRMQSALAGYGILPAVPTSAPPRRPASASR